ncbi:MAG: Rieske (2Fe-2S) protein, partial [Haloferacaceae archaeon]
ATWSELADREPTHARVEGGDLVVVRYDGEVSVMYGRCLHRGVLLGDGRVEGQNLICGVHGWDYRVDTACGHDSLSGFERRDLTTWKREIADLTDVEYAGVGRED